MSDLARRLIQQAEADLASRLEAIEAATDTIDAADTLAATLRHHGIDARANGHSSGTLLNLPHSCTVWVIANSAGADDLLAAIRAAELRIDDIRHAVHGHTLHLDGIAAPLYISSDTAKDLYQRLKSAIGQLAEGLAHG